jgi:hypothetical protein
MRSLLAALRSLTLPSGAINGPKIVLDGITGRIELYDSNNVLVGSWSPSRFQVLTPEGSEVRIQAFASSAAMFLFPETPVAPYDYDPATLFSSWSTADEIPFTALTSPAIIDGTNYGSRIDIYGSDLDDGHEGRILFSPGADGTVNVQTGADFLVNDRSIGRGSIGYVLQTGDDPLAAGVEELVDILVLNDLNVIGGRIYGCRGKLSFGPVSTRVNVRLRYTEDGSVPTTASAVLPAGTFVFNTNAVGTTGGSFLFDAKYQPAADAAFSIGVFANADAGLNSITGANQAGWLQVIDEGV